MYMYIYINIYFEIYLGLLKGYHTNNIIYIYYKYKNNHYSIWELIFKMKKC